MTVEQLVAQLLELDQALEVIDIESMEPVVGVAVSGGSVRFYTQDDIDNGI
jgi:hypothetical protein